MNKDSNSESGFSVLRSGKSVPLLPEGMLSQPLMKSLVTGYLDTRASEIKGRKPSTSPEQLGILDHPFDMGLATKMTDLSPYHGSCQRTLVAATCAAGVGIIDEDETQKKSKKLRGLGEVDTAHLLPVIDEEATRKFYDWADSVCDYGFDLLLNQVVQNYWGTGNGYIEVGYSSASIDSLWWVPSQFVWRYQLAQNDERAFCWMYSPAEGPNTHNTLESYMYRHGTVCSGKDVLIQQQAGGTPASFNGHELIEFVQPTAQWLYYGGPHWLAAVPQIEVDWRALQRMSDYMVNNGVPETLIVIGGVTLSREQRAELEATLSGAGNHNYGRSGLLTFPRAGKSELFFHAERLQQDLEGSGWATTQEVVNLGVASANQVPPVLAGITVPGKMGASNELVMALVQMQNSVIHAAQRNIALRLSKTLLGRKCGGPSSIVGKRLRFRTILEVNDIVALNTVARQREQVAANPKRDPKEGLERG